MNTSITSGPNQKTILLVEDEVGLQEAAKLKLEENGFRVLIAASGEEALKVLETEHPALIWLDVLLPGINGITVLGKIRENQKFKDLPVVIVSVSSGHGKVQSATDLNVLDYIVKSDYTLDDIIERVKSFL